MLGKALILLAFLASPVAADECAAVSGRLAEIGQEYVLGPQALAEKDGWCQLDGAALMAKAVGQPNLSVETLRVRGSGLAGAPTPAEGFLEIEVEITGLRVTPKISDRTIDARLKAFLRVQVADLSFVARWNPETGDVQVRQLVLALTGGTRLTGGADLAGVDVATLRGTKLTLLTARLMQMDMELVVQGQALRPLIEASGQAREKALVLVPDLPDAAFDADSKAALGAWLTALPQAGVLRLALRSPDGIGALQVALAGRRGEPLGPEAIAQVFQGATVQVDWQPGAGN